MIFLICLAKCSKVKLPYINYCFNFCNLKRKEEEEMKRGLEKLFNDENNEIILKKQKLNKKMKKTTIKMKMKKKTKKKKKMKKIEWCSFRSEGS